MSVETMEREPATEWRWYGRLTFVELAALRGVPVACEVCGRTRDLAIDHIESTRWGGSDRHDNLQLLCRSCNSSKCSQDMGAWLPRRLAQLDRDRWARSVLDACERHDAALLDALFAERAGKTW